MTGPSLTSAALVNIFAKAVDDLEAFVTDALVTAGSVDAGSVISATDDSSVFAQAFVDVGALASGHGVDFIGRLQPIPIMALTLVTRSSVYTKS